ASPSNYEIVYRFWQTQWPQSDFENTWNKALQTGMVEGTALSAKTVKLRNDFLNSVSKAQSEVRSDSGLEIIFMPDPTIWDGQFSNNAWLQELPKPITKLTWDNAALMSPLMAEGLGLANEEVVELHYRGRQVKAPVWIVPGHSENSVTVTLGYGRRQAGQIGTSAGFNAYALRTSDAPWFGEGLEIVKTDEHYSLVTTQHHHSMEGRDIVREGTFAEFQENPYFAHGEPPSESLYAPGFKYSGYAWGM